MIVFNLFGKEEGLRYGPALLLAVILCMIYAFPNSAFGSPPVLGAKAAAMGGAFAGIADDPSAVAINPAGLASLKGHSIYAGLSAIMLSSEYESLTAKTEDTIFQVFFPPHLYLTSDFGLKDKAFGLGIFSPFGIGGRKWSEGGLTRYFATENLVGTLAINPTFAWRVHPKISLGMGVDFLYAVGSSEKMINQSRFNAADAKTSLETTGTGWGYNLGLLLCPGKKFSLGLAYRSRIKADVDGTLTIEGIAPGLQPLFGSDRFESDTTSSFTFPDILSLGIALRPSQKLTLGISVEWIGWSVFSEQRVDIKSEVARAGLTDIATELDWKDVWTLAAGVDYQLNPALALRSGYTYHSSAVPERTLDPGNPDADQHSASIGLGWMVSGVTLDLFYSATFFEKRNVANSTLSGQYDSFIHTAGVSVAYKF